MKLRWLGRGPWIELGNGSAGWASGYASPPEGGPLEDGEIARYLADRSGDLGRAAAELNGCFAAALRVGSNAVLVTDRFETTPLYWLRENEGIAASDDPFLLVPALRSSPEIDVAASLDMLRCGYVLGTRTLISGVETVGPATVAEHRATGESRRRYWTYGYRPREMPDGEATDRLEAALRNVAQRLLGRLERRGLRPALTLSGGLDSRVLAALLRSATDRPVGALTYGSADHPDVLVAEEVARELDLDFSVQPIQSDYARDEFLARSVREVGFTTRFTCGVGARHLDGSDFDVVVPGHTGDFVSGGHLPVYAGMVRSAADLAAFVEFRHFRYQGSEAALRRIAGRDLVRRSKETVRRSTEELDWNADTLGTIDRWNVEHRQRRLILMELRAYEALGQWALPFYDHELIDAFAVLPHRLRIGQRLYIETSKTRLFTGRAAAAGTIRRVGKPMRADTRLVRRIELMQRLQPLSGAFLRRGITRYRELSRALRPRRDQKHGTDTFKAWYRDDPAFRAFVLERLRRIDLPWLDADALRVLLESDGQEERIYNRLLVGALTIQECYDAVRSDWRDAPPTSTGPSTSESADARRRR
ncbi:MAG: asparagine synthase-related protein [Planctomycetota bacterium]